MVSVPPSTSRHAFEILREEVMTAFKQPNYDLELDSRLCSRVQGEDESATSYCYSVLSLCSKIDPNMPEVAKVQHVLRGLLLSLLEKIYPFLNPQGDVRVLLRQVQVQSQASTMDSRRSTSTGPSLSFRPSSVKTEPTSSFITQDELAESLKKIETGDDRGFCVRLQATTGRYPGDLRNELKTVGSGTGKRPIDQVDDKGSNKKGVTCHHCGKPGHIERFCFKKQNKKQPDNEAGTSTPSESKPSKSGRKN